MRQTKSSRTDREWFGSSNRWGIPDLSRGMLASEVPAELTIHRAGRHDAETSGGKTVAFFVHDWKFESSWTYPNRFVNGLLRSQWASACSPDFSVWTDAPLAEQIWSVYRTRWVSRFWQYSGLKIIPTLNWGGPETYDFAFAGIPQDIPVAAIETQTGGKSDGFASGLRRACEVIRPQNLIVYGVRPIDVPEGVQVHYFESQTARMRAQRKDL